MQPWCCLFEPALKASRHAIGHKVGLQHAAGHLQRLGNGVCLKCKHVEQHQAPVWLLLLLLLLWAVGFLLLLMLCCIDSNKGSSSWCW
jgi:hypothetical protein